MVNKFGRTFLILFEMEVAKNQSKRHPRPFFSLFLFANLWKIIDKNNLRDVPNYKIGNCVKMLCTKFLKNPFYDIKIERKI